MGGRGGSSHGGGGGAGLDYLKSRLSTLSAAVEGMFGATHVYDEIGRHSTVIDAHATELASHESEISALQSGKIDKAALLNAGIESATWTTVRSEISITTVEDRYKTNRPEGTNVRFWTEFAGGVAFSQENLYRVTVNGVTSYQVCKYGILKNTEEDTDLPDIKPWSACGNLFLYDSRYRDTGEDYCVLYVENNAISTNSEYYYSVTVGNGILLSRTAGTYTLEIECATNLVKKNINEALTENNGRGDCVYDSSLGRGNVSDGENSASIGRGNIASGKCAVAIGYENTADAYASSATGFNTKATGISAHAEGAYTIASGDSSHAEGSYSGYLSDNLFTTASGSGAHAEGFGTVASGSSAHSEGSRTKATARQTHAEGYGTTASGMIAHSEGYSTTASGNFTHAEGMSCTASGNGSHAEGDSSIASGVGSHAEGFYSGNQAAGLITEASGVGAHAEGSGTTASGQVAHSEGNLTVAYGNYSHAEGYSNTVNGTGSHIEGCGNTSPANITAAHIQGVNCSIANESSGKTVKIKYKTGKSSTSTASLTLGKYAHVVGNGASDTSRSNAHTLDWDGNAWFAGGIEAAGGTLKIGNTTITEQQLIQLLALLS